MAPRAQWKGYLKLSLVSCPIALFPAASPTERVSFRQINKETGNRLRQQLVDAVTGETVSGEQKGRGYEIARDQFIVVEDEELEALQVESTRTIDIDRFVPRDQIDIGYLDSPYYIVPNDNVGQEAFAVIREAMRAKGVVALGHVVLSRRERVIMLEPFRNGLRGVTLRYPYEMRGADTYFEDIAEVKVSGEMLKLAEHILDSKAGEFDPATFEDRYETAVVDMLRRKQAGLPEPKEHAEPRAQNVVNLMDALRQSIAQESGKGSAPPATRRKTAVAPTARRTAGKARAG